MHEYSVELARWELPLHDDTQSHLKHEFKRDLSEGICNSTALLELDPVKSLQRLRMASSLAYKVDIFFIVEAHGQEGEQVNLVHELKNSHRVEYFSVSHKLLGE